jgi:hypothetical protein
MAGIRCCCFNSILFFIGWNLKIYLAFLIVTFPAELLLVMGQKLWKCYNSTILRFRKKKHYFKLWCHFNFSHVTYKFNNPTYRFIVNMLSTGPTFAQSKTDVFRLIWKSKAPSKVTAFVWQLLLDKSQRDTIYCLGEWHCRFCPEVVCFVKLRSKIQGTSFCTVRMR